MPETENTKALLRGINGAQEVLFALIRALLKVLPIGILAFAAQLSSQLEAGVIVGALGRYTLVIMAGNLIQFFIVLPLFLLIRGLNPVRVMKAMSPALAVALLQRVPLQRFLSPWLLRKKTCASIPPSAVSFSPICTTINMNGCAAFILVTSIFLMQNGGMELSFGTMIVWLFISVFAAIGNAGVPMGCYFPTPVAHERCRRPHRHHGNHPPHLHHHRYD